MPLPRNPSPSYHNSNDILEWVCDVFYYSFNALGHMHGDNFSMDQLFIDQSGDSGYVLNMQPPSDSSGYFFSEADPLCLALSSSNNVALTTVQFRVAGPSGASTAGMRLSGRVGQTMRDGQPIDGCGVGAPFEYTAVTFQQAGLTTFSGEDCFQIVRIPLSRFTAVNPNVSF